MTVSEVTGFVSLEGARVIVEPRGRSRLPRYHLGLRTGRGACWTTACADEMGAALLGHMPATEVRMWVSCRGCLRQMGVQ